MASTPPPKRKTTAPAPRQLWGEQETALLVDLWEDRLVDLRRQNRNATVYDDIVEALRQAGYARTRLQVQHKIENLTQTYRYWLKNQTTGAGAIPWAHFWRMHSFLGTLPANDPSRAQESQVTVEEVIMGMVCENDQTAAEFQDELQEGDSALGRLSATDTSGLNSLSACCPPSSIPDSPSTSSPSSPATSTATSAASVAAKGQRVIKNRKTADDVKQQILAEHKLLREQLATARQKEYEQRERQMQMQQKFFDAMTKYVEKIRNKAVIARLNIRHAPD